ncbi:MAG: PstS family phosphate ABC transporter substrate-binding protein [Deltaproteobacteria bacterium]|nr:PstS family phosphate ABC transporter substrate-binding protein [Deltaproteobacteria bacterium]
MRNTLLISIAVASLTFFGCSKRSNPGSGGAGTAPKAAIIAIDGSSTVFPITEAVAEEFQKGAKARVTIGVSGTGGGFKKFCNKETAISGASRPIKEKEVTLCKKNGVAYIELPVAYDGIAVVVHKENTWVDSLTVAELKKLWEPSAQKKVTRWRQIRPNWPDQEIHLFGPGVDSGTYDYFTKAIVGTEHASRGDFTSSEDDNILVKGISTDKLALGFFGYAYYAENKDKLRLVPVDDNNDANGKGPIAPSPTTVADGTYQPLGRPIFIYVAKEAAARQEVSAFVDFYLSRGAALAAEVGYISLPPRAYTLAKARYATRTVGSVFAGHGSKVGVTVEQLLSGK